MLRLLHDCLAQDDGILTGQPARAPRLSGIAVSADRASSDRRRTPAPPELQIRRGVPLRAEAVLPGAPAALTAALCYAGVVGVGTFIWRRPGLRTPAVGEVTLSVTKNRAIIHATKDVHGSLTYSLFALVERGRGQGAQAPPTCSVIALLLRMLAGREGSGSRRWHLRNAVRLSASFSGTRRAL